MVDLVFVVDILVNFNTAYMADGEWVVDRREIGSSMLSSITRLAEANSRGTIFS